MLKHTRTRCHRHFRAGFIATILGLFILATDLGAASAQFSDALFGGPMTLTTTVLSTPVGLVAGVGPCVSTQPIQSNITASWTGSSIMDNYAGNYMIQGYSLLRSGSSTGTYSQAASTSGNPPPTSVTDSSQSGAVVPSAYVAGIPDTTAVGTLADPNFSNGGNPYTVAITPNGNQAWVENYGSSNVSVIDTATHKVIRTVALTGSNPSSIIITPNGQYAFVGDWTNNGVWAINTSTYATTFISTSYTGDPVGLASTPNSSEIFVSNFYGGSVSVVSTSSLSVVATIPLPPGAAGSSAPAAIQVTPNGNTAYVVDQANSVVYPIAVSTNALGSAIAVGSQTDANDTNGGPPNNLVITPNSSYVYVGNFASSSVSVISTASNSVIDTISLTGSEPTGLTMLPSGTSVYVASYANNVVYPISVSSNTVGTAISVGTLGDPTAIVTNSNSTTVAVANYSSSTVSEINTASNLVTTYALPPQGTTSTPSSLAFLPNSASLEVVDQANDVVISMSNAATAINTSTNATSDIQVGQSLDPNIKTGGDPNAVAITPNGSLAYVTNYSSGTVSVISTSTNTLQATIALPGSSNHPNAIAITPNGAMAYVTSYGNNEVFPITIATNSVGTPITVGTLGDPAAIAASPNSSQIYVANFGSASITVIDVATGSTTTIALPAIAKPSALTFLPNGQYAYVVDAANSLVYPITVSSQLLGVAIPIGTATDPNLTTGGNPNMIVPTPDSSTVFVGSWKAGTITAIATATNTPTTITPAGTNHVTGLAITPNGCTLFAAIRNHAEVIPIPVSTLTPGTPISVGPIGDPSAIAATPNSNTVLIANFAASSITPIDVATDTAQTSVSISDTPTALAIMPTTYWYELQATRFNFASAPTAPVSVQLGSGQVG